MWLYGSCFWTLYCLDACGKERIHIFLPDALTHNLALVINPEGGGARRFEVTRSAVFIPQYGVQPSGAVSSRSLRLDLDR